MRAWAKWLRFFHVRRKAAASLAVYREAVAIQGDMIKELRAVAELRARDLERRIAIAGARADVSRVYEARAMTYRRLDGLEESQAWALAGGDPMLATALHLSDRLAEVIIPEAVAREADALLALRGLLLPADSTGRAVDGVFLGR